MKERRQSINPKLCKYVLHKRHVQSTSFHFLIFVLNSSNEVDSSIKLVFQVLDSVIVTTIFHEILLGSVLFSSSNTWCY